ncbi:hypothetical protein AMATHDRAFT_9253 [Amanita thiersii Skay4041]|uniref:Uncharacterized protein n=1 Tax=Amanita thiersii Skay4041 TaxID=703135 RepID=A0A2A9NCT8_9AGAR|nr:hypothetical protein AMATHDRAFT_9253 [Amanita thiersii Skay4041]
MVPHYTSTTSTIDSRPSASLQKYQGPPSKGAWETVPKAISLLHRMGIKPTIQSVKTTEELLLESADPLPTTKKQKFKNTIPKFSLEEPITAPDPKVVTDWDDIVSLGEDPPETSTEAETVEDTTELVDESMDYLFKELIQDA